MVNLIITQIKYHNDRLFHIHSNDKKYEVWLFQMLDRM